MRSQYITQVEMILDLLPFVMKEPCFALKGGTALNFFVLDAPRFSVDVDLTYVPIEDRKTSLNEISQALIRIKERVQKQFINHIVQEKRLPSGHCVTLFITYESSVVKIEVNTILRGTVFQPVEREINPAVKQKLGIEKFMIVTILSPSELYGGKICAALDRQHPRDLFDIKLLFECEGLTDDIRKAFVVYLASHNRPMHELLNPTLLDIRPVFENEFAGMTEEPVTCNELEEARKTLIARINSDLTNNERQFLLSLKKGEPKWSSIGVEEIEKLPALQWKLTNIRRMKKEKHVEAVERLQRILQL